MELAKGLRAGGPRLGAHLVFADESSFRLIPYVAKNLVPRKAVLRLAIITSEGATTSRPSPESR